MSGYKKLLGWIALLCCLSLPGVVSAVPASAGQSAYDRLEWSTKGGGDLHFFVVKLGNVFQIVRSRVSFKPAPRTVMLTSSSTQPQDQKIYALLNDLFSQPPAVKPGNQAKSDHLLTGSWTTVMMGDTSGDKQPVEVIMDGRLNALYDYVHAWPK